MEREMTIYSEEIMQALLGHFAIGLVVISLQPHSDAHYIKVTPFKVNRRPSDNWDPFILKDPLVDVEEFTQKLKDLSDIKKQDT